MLFFPVDISELPVIYSTLYQTFPTGKVTLTARRRLPISKKGHPAAVPFIRKKPNGSRARAREPFGFFRIKGTAAGWPFLLIGSRLRAVRVTLPVGNVWYKVL